MKKINYLLFTFLTFLVCISSTYALEKTTGRIASTTGLRVRSGPGTSYEKIITVPHNARVTITSYKDAGNGCTDKWAEIIYEEENASYKGYVCSTFIEDIETVTIPDTNVDTENNTEEDTNTETGSDNSNDNTNNNTDNDNNSNNNENNSNQDEEENSSIMANMTDEEFEAYLTSQGFPESYKVKLRELHKKHPTWIFKGIKSKYTWSAALEEQNVSGTSLLNVNSSMKEKGYEGYLSTDLGNYDYITDKFVAHDGIYWFQANNATISYYMDPRNFLTEESIFMFEDLLYNSSYQNANTVNKILTSSFMQQFTPYFMEAATAYNVSPMYLAALSRQEVGLSDTNIVTNGKAGILSDGIDYTGYYNFFNIGASSSGDPKLKSLQSARAYNWNTQQKSIVEGSYKITVNYVQCGQYTSYFQKFNLSPTATKGIWHQYTTNISALVSPAKTTYNSYNSMGIIDEDFSFSIPIFEGMPESTSLPTLGNPNNWLKELKINGQLVTNFNGDNTNYTVVVPYTESITIEATSVNNKATVTGTGTKELNEEENKFSIIVTAQNGSIKTYNVEITREDKIEIEDGVKEDEKEEIIIKVSDVLTSTSLKYDDNYIWNIPLSTNVEGIINKLTENYKTISVNIKNKAGQIKNEGTIVSGDKIEIATNGENKTLEVIIYGDVNGDGITSASDLLNTQKHILGYTTLLGSYNKAADVNKDGKISASDILNIQKHILGYSNISQG